MADGTKPDTKPVNKYLNTKVEVERVGTKIVLPGEPPPGMNYDEALEVITRLKKDEEEEFAVSEQIGGYHFLDGAVAFWRAIITKYGVASPVVKQTFFGPEPPRMLTIATGPNVGDSIQVPWGVIKIPGVENPVETSVNRDENGMYVFMVSGKLRRKHVHLLKELVELARQMIQSESIYRGKAIAVSGEGKDTPRFIDTLKTAEEELILNTDIAQLVEVNVMTPIKQTELCLKHNIPIKRGILLEGHYGTGKSLTGAAVARACVANGWTYILLDDVGNLEGALRFARHYAPAVVFAEDIDRVLSERDDAGNNLINTIDGVISKNTKVVTVLTTNFADKLDRSMLRPGRLDAVIHYDPPNAESVQKLIHLYSRGLIKKGETLKEIGKSLAGEIPATIREVVERAKLAMISRADEFITEDDLLVSALGMRQHLALLKSEKKDLATDAASRFSQSLIDLIRDGTGIDGTGITETIESIESAVDDSFKGVTGQMGVFQHAEEEGDKSRHRQVGEKLEVIENRVKAIQARVGG